MRFATAFLLACSAFLSASRAQVPIYEVTPVESSITFGVESSVPIKGTFDKWDAEMTFTSRWVKKLIPRPNKSMAGNDLRILGFSAGTPLSSDLENA